MNRLRFTIRVRLTLLYTVLFAAGGAVVVTVIYLLVAAGLQTKNPDGQLNGKPAGTTVDAADFAEQCRTKLLTEPEDTNLRAKCESAYREGVSDGKQTVRDATLASLLRYSVSTLGGVTVLSAAAGWVVAGRALRPVHRITAAARDASEHRLTNRVALGGPHDELRELADTFDAMLDRMQASFDSHRRFIANAGHELRTPMTVMRAAVDVVLAKPAATREELVVMGEEVRAAVGHAESLIDALLTLARNEHGLVNREPADLATVVEDALDARDAGALRVHLSLAPAPLAGDPVLLERLVANLLDNAVRYNVEGGDVWLQSSTVDESAVLTVANTGPVLDPADVPGLFAPFHRAAGRVNDGGFGLGLAIVDSIATVHGGRAGATANPDGGLTVTVHLPQRHVPAPR